MGRRISAKIGSSSVAVGFVAVVCAFVWGEDLRVGVYSGAGQEGILTGLVGVADVRATPLTDFSPVSLANCDVVVWPWGRLETRDRTRPWRILLTEYVKMGGGLILTHDAAGGAGQRRGDMKDSPLFPEVATIPGMQARKLSVVCTKVQGMSHALLTTLPDEVTHAYYDHMALVAGPKGTVLMVDEDGDPIVVAGTVGNGRVVIMGNLPGYKGTRVVDKITGLASVTGEGEVRVAGGELALMVESLKWAGTILQKDPILPIELETTLGAAAVRAVHARNPEKEPICVFSSEIAGHRLRKDTWTYEEHYHEGKERDWGLWWGEPYPGPLDMGYVAFISGKADSLLSSRKKFERGSVSGRFAVSCDVILTDHYTGVLDISLVDDQGSGYGVQLAFIGADDDADTRVAGRRRVAIGDARNAIFSSDKGEKSILVEVEGDNSRLRAPEEGFRVLPVRLERSEEGELTLSLGGKVVATVKDSDHDGFTKFVANTPTARAHLAFDNAKVVGYFSKDTEEVGPTPWIVPEPKEMTKNGEIFALADGAQFVVSDKAKIDTYLLEEWIIPEIEGYHGIRMKAVTLDEIDRSKPAIYLGESSDPAFADVFDPKLKAISEEEPGPEGYAILVTNDRAQAAGATERGTFWALQSLVQLLERRGDTLYVRGAEISDWPDFALRGSTSQLWTRIDGIQSNMERAQSAVRLFARYKANAFMLGGKYFDFPSYDLSGYGCEWSFRELAEIIKLCGKYHIDVIPYGYSLCHAGLRVAFYLSRTNPELWKWIVDNNILADDLSDIRMHNTDSFNALSDDAWQMCKNLNQDFIDINPNGEFFLTPFDEINPPIHTYAPEDRADDLLLEWILKCHKHMKDNGKRMMMFSSYLTEAAKFPDSSASLGRTGSEGMRVHDLIDRIPKDIILVDWYYATSPDRGIYKYLKDKGFDVVAMPGSVYGIPYESVYYSAVEGKKADILGIIAFGCAIGGYVNPQWGSYALPWIYGWTVPDKMEPDWPWQEHWQDVFQGPLPSHTGTVVPLDISASCNESRTDDKAGDGIGWLDYGRISDLRKLSAGELAYRDRYRFHIVDEAANNGKSVVVVSIRKGEKDDEAGRVAGIPVGCEAKSLVFLHASTSLGTVYASDVCGYRMHYADGTSAMVRVKYGHQIGPWMFAAGTGNPRLNLYYGDGYLSWCRLIKTGRTATGERTGLYAYEWVNPQPDKKIASIDMEVTIDRDIRVALVALSVVK